MALVPVPSLLHLHWASPPSTRRIALHQVPLGRMELPLPFPTPTSLKLRVLVKGQLMLQGRRFSHPTFHGMSFFLDDGTRIKKLLSRWCCLLFFKSCLQKTPG